MRNYTCSESRGELFVPISHPFNYFGTVKASIGILSVWTRARGQMSISLFGDTAGISPVMMNEGVTGFLPI
jgi:hypothetical protein